MVLIISLIINTIVIATDILIRKKRRKRKSDRSIRNHFEYCNTRKDIAESRKSCHPSSLSVFQPASSRSSNRWSYFSRQCVSFFYELTGGSSRWWYRLSSQASSGIYRTPRMRECSGTAGIPKNVLVKRLRGNALRVTRKIAPLANQTLFGPTPRILRDSSPAPRPISLLLFGGREYFSPQVVPFFYNVRLELFLHARIYYFLRCWLVNLTLCHNHSRELNNTKFYFDRTI